MYALFIFFARLKSCSTTYCNPITTYCNPITKPTTEGNAEFIIAEFTASPSPPDPSQPLFSAAVPSRQAPPQAKKDFINSALINKDFSFDKKFLTITDQTGKADKVSETITSELQFRGGIPLQKLTHRSFQEPTQHWSGLRSFPFLNNDGFAQISLHPWRSIPSSNLNPRRRTTTRSSPPPSIPVTATTTAPPPPYKKISQFQI